MGNDENQVDFPENMAQKFILEGLLRVIHVNNGKMWFVIVTRTTAKT